MTEKEEGRLLSTAFTKCHAENQFMLQTSPNFLQGEYGRRTIHKDVVLYVTKYI